ncbi:MAG TPA: SdpI family protein [Candidatus Enterococcus stercoripullorum]|nr:SdpI family protein [Candidatus Enterococcus stercoripullorum]
MTFWIFMFIVTLLIPITLLLTWYLCPRLKKINNIIGYRSARSKKNQDTWNFAQKYSAKISLYLFFPTLTLSVVIMPMFIHKSMDTIGWIGLAITVIQMLIFVIIIVSTEHALKKTFDGNGNRY